MAVSHALTSMSSLTSVETNRSRLGVGLDRSIDVIC